MTEILGLAGQNHTRHGLVTSPWGHLWVLM